MKKAIGDFTIRFRTDYVVKYRTSLTYVRERENMLFVK